MWLITGDGQQQRIGTEADKFDANTRPVADRNRIWIATTSGIYR